MFLLSGVARYLFVPLAEAVVFAMCASYFFSRTLIPTLSMYLLREHKADGEVLQARFAAMQRFQQAFERRFSALRERYRHALDSAITNRRRFIPTFLLLCL